MEGGAFQILYKEKKYPCRKVLVKYKGKKEASIITLGLKRGKLKAFE
jgi:hypothetical protein